MIWYCMVVVVAFVAGWHIHWAFDPVIYKNSVKFWQEQSNFWRSRSNWARSEVRWMKEALDYYTEKRRSDDQSCSTNGGEHDIP